MPQFSQYGSGQQAGFALVCIGFLICCLGGCVPYWLSAEITVGDVTGFLSNVPVIGSIFSDVKALEFNAGIWRYCIKIVLSSDRCSNFYMPKQHDYVNSPNLAIGDRFDWITIIRVSMVANVLLGCVCVFAACCRCLCCSGGRTICHGIISFFAACAGFSATAFFVNNSKTLFDIPLLDVKYEWAIYIYSSGSCLMGISSFFLCFGMPNNMNAGRVIHPAGGVQVAVNQELAYYPGAPPTNQFQLAPHHVPPQPMLYPGIPSGSAPGYNEPYIETKLPQT